MKLQSWGYYQQLGFYVKHHFCRSSHPIYLTTVYHNSKPKQRITWFYTEAEPTPKQQAGYERKYALIARQQLIDKKVALPPKEPPVKQKFQLKLTAPDQREIVDTTIETTDGVWTIGDQIFSTSELSQPVVSAINRWIEIHKPIQEGDDHTGTPTRKRRRYYITIAGHDTAHLRRAICNTL